MDANVTAQCELQAEIKKFSDIIDSNNTALGAIAQLQQHLHEHGRIEVPFMVRKTTCILVETFKMIKRINELCGNRYSNLFDVYEDIASAIKTKLGEGPGHRDRKTVEKLVIPFSDIDGSHADAVGGKISFLCDIRNRTGVPVPDGFAITEGAYRLFVERNSLGERIRSMIAADRQSGDGALPAGLTDIEALYRASSEIQQMIISSSLPDELNKAIRDAVKVLKAHSPPDLRLAVRSSALFESNSFTSFAGQYRSVLNIPEDEVNSAYLRVVASKFTPEAMVYASAHGYEIADLSMCAGVQRMIDARSSGIMYTYTEGWPMVMIQSVYGLGLYIVNGSLVPDTYVYDCTSHRISSVTTGEKSVMLTCDRYGTKEERVGEHDRARPSLDNDQAVLLASIGERLGKRYKSSLDIEWAIDSRSNIHILQCRYLPSAPCRDARDREGYDFDIEWAVDENGEPYVLEYVQKNRKRFSLGMAIPQRQIPNRIIVGGGATASPGAIAGKAFHVDSDLEIMRFPAGAIAIAKTANPRLAVLLKKAAGIVSEKGDIAGHLATVARETDIPALFGTGNADIPDGTDITLDATHKKVYEGTVRELASSRRDDRKMSPSGLPLRL
ncbi:MAG: PEP-utilizing enzyme [Deltaproteobacteria bacterium]|nr:PEP-utilizing enzyme [Deltaproteobacteria bacterium]